ncbi:MULTISPECIES: SDR family oxidoreductase [unclassified Streptomyces]|uniref:SDR family oxidoreductase n=1 Tax=unclassified Streptomyces TaxID=2593676 RepID=UPI0033A157A0
MTSHPIGERTAMALGTAVIVGVGPGLGLAIARTFANAGHPVAMLARDKARLDTYAAGLATTGQDVRGYVADAADPDNLRAALHSAITELGAPDVLVYNVGVLRKDSPIGGDDQDWANVTAINVLGARVAANAVLPELRDGRGSLLFTGGGYALSPSKEHASLSVGKAALRAYVQVLHDQLAGTGVHATSVTITRDIGGGEARFDPAVLAQAYLELHNQPEAEWQHELMRY